MPPKIDAFNDGINLGQMEVVLTVLVEKLSSDPVLHERAKELLPEIDILKMFIRAKCLKRTTDFKDERNKLQELDEKINLLIDEMKKLNINFY